MLLQQPEVRSMVLLLVIACGAVACGVMGLPYLSLVVLVALVSVAKYVGIGNKVSAKDLSSVRGKKVLITGGNSGIGFATALELAKNGAEVIIGCRSETRAKTSIESLKSLCGSTAVNVSYEIMDLSSLESVRTFASKWGTRRLDILINNAGVMQCPFALSADGYELQFATNHLGHFMLTNLLLKCIPNDGRIVNLTSLGHMYCSNPVNWRTLGEKETYDAGIAYGNSKLANIYFTKELQRQMKEKENGIIVAAVHPGVVRTDLIRSYHPIAKLFLAPLLFIIAKTPKGGAQTSLTCATAKGITPGGYYSNCKLAKPSKQAEDLQGASKLWKISEEMTSSSH